VSVRAAQHTALQLKRIAQRQLKNVEPRRRTMPISPSEQLRRFRDGAEFWRVEQGLVTPEQYQRYIDRMAQRLREGR